MWCYFFFSLHYLLSCFPVFYSSSLLRFDPLNRVLIYTPMKTWKMFFFNSSVLPHWKLFLWLWPDHPFIWQCIAIHMKWEDPVKIPAPSLIWGILWTRSKEVVILLGWKLFWTCQGKDGKQDRSFSSYSNNLILILVSTVKCLW